MSGPPTGAPPAGPGPVWDVVNGLAAFGALSAALELGLFDALAAAGQPGLAPEELAAAVSASDAGAVELLAEVLVSLGLLTGDGRAVALTPVAEHFLVSDSPASMAALGRLSPGPWSGWQQLAATVRTGAVPAGTRAELAAGYPDLVRATAPTQRAVAAGVAAALAGRELWPAAPRVVDLGCGSGAWLAALLADRPGATAVGVDLPGVLPVARDTVAEAGLDPRVSLLAGDYLEVDLPAGAADVVVLAHVLRAEPAERARRLLLRALDLLAPGGVVVVADYPRPDPAAAPDPDRSAVLAGARHELLLSLTMAAATDGSGVTVADLRAWAGDGGARLTDVLQPVPRQSVFLIRPVPPTATETQR
ncbi:class I SAM-dependent methyltransferase [Trujillonella endophytica]|uniref:Dimerisation domain-containing protein n=1 Tax=Trujillonella endophytica TaxID=673521 RepID=A0A1H8UG57_9ACTN|nr:class I SAM-dependent methyltransferase [Trujillella endophytica]SEP01598.1 Dimerisation domain-containing protein [Trujillella endophytica]